MPSLKATPLEMVETELPFEVLVHPLGAPAKLDDPDQLLARDLRRHRREVVLGRRRLIIFPFHDQPHVLAYRRIDSVVVERNDATEGEARRELVFTTGGSLVPAIGGPLLITGGPQQVLRL